MSSPAERLRMFDLTNLFHSFYINFLQALGLQSDDGGPTNSGPIQTSQPNGPQGPRMARMPIPRPGTNQPVRGPGPPQMPSGPGSSINMPSPNNMGNNIQPNVSFQNHNLFILFFVKVDY